MAGDGNWTPTPASLPHGRLPRAAEYCIGRLKGLLQRRECRSGRGIPNGYEGIGWLGATGTDSERKREEGVTLGGVTRCPRYPLTPPPRTTCSAGTVAPPPSRLVAAYHTSVKRHSAPAMKSLYVPYVRSPTYYTFPGLSMCVHVYMRVRGGWYPSLSLSPRAYERIIYSAEGVDCRSDGYQARSSDRFSARPTVRTPLFPAVFLRFFTPFLSPTLSPPPPPLRFQPFSVPFDFFRFDLVQLALLLFRRSFFLCRINTRCATIRWSRGLGGSRGGRGQRSDILFLTDVVDLDRVGFLSLLNDYCGDERGKK